ncbi:PKD domain-containing protein [Jatrophihabitans telluris]|uniref:PKD domain-containing protein n=1 Tax=Jatrophihabitans telluris TaxID=2038343 RepID=A0ABY4R2H5_9ACTN|nr:PKD domain-containing protein [Jatrophihabitans telluris]UQX89356.1 PKD domain-containing protein [Jatrophihabitans telluris]
MRIVNVRSKRVIAIAAVLGLATSTVTALAISAGAAGAAVSPIADRSASTVTADALPTAQIDGVVWSQAVVGNTVYVGGQFTTARPYGSAAGVNTVSRSNLMAYDLTTGVMTSWNPGTNGVVKSVKASPDGTRVYVAGNFTTAGGANRYRIAAFDTATGSLVSSFAPVLSTQANALAVTNSTVYVGGLFTSATGAVQRNHVAAFSAGNGALLPWNPNADSNINAMVISPVGNKLIIGGSFQNVGGLPAYGLAAVDDTTGALQAWNATTASPNPVRDAGPQAAIESLTTDGTAIYGTGYVFGSGGNLEGTFSADPTTGNLNWIEDCHGDTYDAYAFAGTVYTVSHAHYCGNIGGFPQSDPWSVNQKHALAFTTQATGTIGNDPLGYYNFAGSPSPSLVNWFPDFYTGSYTGQGQAAWTVTGNDKYVVMGGEFPGVNGAAQQGLVRFAVKSIAPNAQKPRVTGAAFVPTLTSFSAGTVRVTWQSNWDRDDKTLTYKVIRDNNTANPVYTVTADSEYWNRPNLGFIDSGVTPGSTHTYRVSATDGSNNTVTGDNVSVTVSTANSSATAYSADVKADGAQHFWPLNESAGTSTSYDYIGFDDLTTNSGVTRTSGSPVTGDSGTASTFDGNTGLAVDPVAVTGPQTFSIEAWFNTTSSTGGKIVGFGNASSGLSSSYDRHIFMDGSGKVYFGVYNNNTSTVASSPGFNDGKWHHVVGTFTNTGLTLYLDGKKIGTNGATFAQDYSGYWRIGGDNSWGGDQYYDGQVADVSIYPTVLTKAQVQKHYVDAGYSLPGSTSPSDKYGKAVYSDSPDIYYRMDDAAGTPAQDVSGNNNNGTYYGNETYGVTSPVTGAGGKAVTFPGTDSSNLASGLISDPKSYTEELWFKTTTTNGGKLIGFGASPTGNSGGYDRHVYMDGDGRLNFGTWTGQTNIATSANNGYNDGAWHYLVATQGSDGMKLYVDDVLVGTNGQTNNQDYDGYWRVGGDTAWNGTSWFQGTVDEVAIYGGVLTQSQIDAHFAAASLINHAPTAVFTATPTNLSVAFDGSASSDPDGALASYSWDFGDGTGSTAVSPTHAYAASGTYTAKLTVTDGGGLTNTVSHDVTVLAANVPPTAAFTATPTGLSAAFDASASHDSDGSIVSYSWSYGDGSSDTGVTPNHTYATSGTYTVTLTVTDDRGGVDTVSHDVVVKAPNVLPTAAFAATPSKLVGSFDASASTDSDGTISSYAWNFGDGSAVQTLTTKTTSHSYATTGTYTVTLVVTDNDGGTATVSHSIVITGNQAPTPAFTSSTNGLAASFNGTGSSDADGTIATYDWDFGDGSAHGSVVSPSHTYAAGGTYTVVLTVTDNDGTAASVSHQVTVTAPNVPPTASFTATPTNLSVALDGTASTDTDGTIASYDWDFGDNSTHGTGSTVSHTYVNAGTYTVKLTVTDDKGAATSTTKSVTVTAPAGTGTVYASDAFGRTSSSGWGTADVGGPWTIGGTASNFTVGNGTASAKVTAAGSGPIASLASVSAADVDVTVDTSMDKAATGTGGAYVNLLVRRTATADYRIKEHFLAGGGLQLVITKVVSGTETILKSYTIPGASYTPGDMYRFHATATGANPTTLTATLFKTGTTEPATQISVTDGTSGLQAAGGFGIQSYLSASSTNAPVVFGYDNLRVVAPGTPVGTNNPPTAAFTSAANGLTVGFDAGTSTDSDGTIASYDWDFGDGTTHATTKAPSHTYANAGTYSVKLTVTDNGGATNSITKSLTVTAPAANQPPVAAFTSSTNGLVASFDGSTSTDDGTITGYDWNFGDNTAHGTAINPSHTYASAGTYSVTLTVTDNGNLTNAITKSVTVTAAGAQVFASDAFTRTVANGWGTADQGGAWTVATASLYNVNGSAATMAMKTAGSGPTAYLNSVSQQDAVLAVDASLDSAATGGGTYVNLVLRHSGTTDYRVKARFVAGGSVQMLVTKVVAGVETTLKSLTVSGVTYTAGDVYRIKATVSGNGTTTLSGKIWKAGTAEPALAQISTTDTEASLQRAGSFGLQSYLSGSATTLPVTAKYDNLSVTALQ